MIELFQNLTFKIQGRSQSSMSHTRYNNLSTHIPVIPPVDRPPFLRCNCLKELTLKIQGQGHGWGLNSNTLLTHIPLVPCQLALSFMRYSIFQIWPRKYKVKAIAQGHTVGITPYRPLPFLGYSYFKIWRRKFKVKVMDGARVESQNMDPINIRPTHILFVPCQSGFPFLSFDFLNLTLKIKGQGPGWGHSSKSQCGSNTLSTRIPFVPCHSVPQFLRYNIFKILPWKSRVKVMGAVTVQSHNVDLSSYWLESISLHVNRPSHSWDTDFTIWPWKSKGQGQMTMVLHTYRYRQFYRIWMV